MVFRMLAVFGEESARPPTGLSESPRFAHHFQSEAEQLKAEELCKKLLDDCLSVCKHTDRKCEVLGHGSGYCFESSPYCNYAHSSSVHVLFAGEVSSWPGVNAVSEAHDAYVRNEPPLEENDAHWLLDFYSSFHDSAEENMRDRALECLSQITGSFAFVIYDSARRRVLAARDANGSQPMYWGATPEGQLLFGSCIEDLASCEPSATTFPAGILFVSEPCMIAYSPGERGWVIAGDDYPGQVLSFVKADPQHWRGVKAIPRITSKGVMHGAVFKVSSQTQMVS